MLKYEDLLLDGRWKFVRWEEGGRAVFENIYNHMEVILSCHQIKNVIEGKTTVAQIMCRRIKADKTNDGNIVISCWKKQKRRYAMASSQKNSDR